MNLLRIFPSYRELEEKNKKLHESIVYLWQQHSRSLKYIHTWIMQSPIKPSDMYAIPYTLWASKYNLFDAIANEDDIVEWSKILYEVENIFYNENLKIDIRKLQVIQSKWKH